MSRLDQRFSTLILDEGSDLWAFEVAVGETSAYIHVLKHESELREKELVVLRNLFNRCCSRPSRRSKLDEFRTDTSSSADDDGVIGEDACKSCVTVQDIFAN